MIGSKGKTESGPAVYFFKYDSDEFVLTAFNDVALKLTNGMVKSYVGKSITELAATFPEIRRNMMKCFKTKSVVKCTQTYRLKSTGKEAFFESAYVHIPPDQVLVMTEHIVDVEDNKAKGKGDRFRAAVRLAREKDIALRQVLNHMDKQSAQVKAELQKYVDFVVMPLINRLKQKLAVDLREDIEAIKAAIYGAVPASTDNTSLGQANLTPREVQICELIRNGYQSKEIASILNIAVRTVSKTRQNIRQKLGVSGNKMSLHEVLASRG